MAIEAINWIGRFQAAFAREWVAQGLRPECVAEAEARVSGIKKMEVS